MATIEALLAEVRACTRCKDLPLGPRPLLQAGAGARILIAGQAPGRITHHKGRSFDDVSGKRLREWLGVSRETFYDSERFAILAMGFCYPGTGKAGDLPPRPECAAAWRRKLLAALPNIRLTLVLGRHAQMWHLPQLRGPSLPITRLVQFQDVATSPVIALPHPSPRNIGWVKLNPWFNRDLLPVLRTRVAQLLESP
ncbi:MAG: uracil-DNA glycosylase family protein [Hyphomicrobiales bacterium]